MSIDQLIAKALSTTSEEEAIACLRMARKKGVKGSVSDTARPTGLHNGYNAEYWYNKAYLFYREYRDAVNEKSDLRYKLDRQASMYREKLSVAEKDAAMYRFWSVVGGVGFMIAATVAII